MTDYGLTRLTTSSILRVLTIAAVLFLAAGCSTAEQNLAECRYEVEKIIRATVSAEGLSRGDLVFTCMEARGFKFDPTSGWKRARWW
jgi:hypothetical protein